MSCGLLTFTITDVYFKELTQAILYIHIYLCVCTLTRYVLAHEEVQGRLAGVGFPLSPYVSLGLTASLQAR